MHFWYLFSKVTFRYLIFVFFLIIVSFLTTVGRLFGIVFRDFFSDWPPRTSRKGSEWHKYWSSHFGYHLEASAIDLSDFYGQNTVYVRFFIFSNFFF